MDNYNGVLDALMLAWDFIYTILWVETLAMLRTSAGTSVHGLIKY